ncbi:potassium transporter 5 [Nicotiana attenuata]|uniref:Potassium transporter 5 n=1 Tax=Nicotiana attenuata TaxID=49451 RepID=A0A1J6IKP0_NICAT|nr:potassium transporter 5 [Nicotiana attenuata]
MISGAFSIVAQAQSLGCFPRVKVIHTSAKHEGQVYIPELNYFLMVACVVVTLSFKTTGNLGNAYGICVGIPPIFPHFVSNIPSVHSIIVLVSIKSIPINKVALEERFKFRHVQPREYKVFRCVVRLGYNDLLGKPEEFENQLVEHLKEFIRDEYYILAAHADQVADKEIEPAVSGQLVAGNSSRVYTEEELEQQVDSRVSSAGSIRSMNILAAQSNLSRPGCFPPSGSRWRLLVVARQANLPTVFIRKVKEQGVLYLLGEAEVVTKQDSSFLKKFVVNYAYNFLRKNFRQGEKVMAIPRTRLLRVGMTYEL